MRVIPLRQYARPRFPTRQILDEHPELLALVPARWRANPVVLYVLAGASLLLSGGCAGAKVAPIFQHGEGRAGFGGAPAVDTTYMIPEDEARQIIASEAKKVGILFAPDAQTISNVIVPYLKPTLTIRNHPRPTPKKRTQKIDLKLDGTDRKHKVSYEFVSEEDLAQLQIIDSAVGTARTYDCIGTASLLRDGLARAKPAGRIAVFYDPMARSRAQVRDARGKIDFKASQKAREVETRRAAQGELRKQVQDFIKWLKAQGVI